MRRERLEGRSRHDVPGSRRANNEERDQGGSNTGRHQTAERQGPSAGQARPISAAEVTPVRWRGDRALLVDGGNEALSDRFEIGVRVDRGVDVAAEKFEFVDHPRVPSVDGVT
jgi:hypothetical protein